MASAVQKVGESTTLKPTNKRLNFFLKNSYFNTFNTFNTFRPQKTEYIHLVKTPFNYLCSSLYLPLFIIVPTFVHH